MELHGLSNDPVYQNYSEKIDELTEVQNRLDDKNLSDKERAKLLRRLKRVNNEVDSARRKLRNVR